MVIVVVLLFVHLCYLGMVCSEQSDTFLISYRAHLNVSEGARVI